MMQIYNLYYVRTGMADGVGGGGERNYVGLREVCERSLGASDGG